jgi:glycosidase
MNCRHILFAASLSVVLLSLSCSQFSKKADNNGVVSLESGFVDDEIMPEIPEWTYNAVIYQVSAKKLFVADGDTSGDLAIINTKFEYIKDLGISTIYLKDLFVEKNNQVVDYYHVNPVLATDSLMKQVFNAAKLKGLRIIFDVIPGQASLQLANKDTLREEMKRLFKYWYNMGASGYCIDMCLMLKENDKTFNINDFWSKMGDFFYRKLPNSLMLANHWNAQRAIAAGFQSVVYTDANQFAELFERETGYFSLSGKGSTQAFRQNYIESYKAISHKGLPVLNLTNNLDSASRKNLQQIYAFLFTMPGIPVIQMGDEMGLNKLQDVNFEQLNKLKSDSAFMYSFVKQLIKVRRTEYALTAYSRFTTIIDSTSSYPVTYLRINGNQSILVAINPSGQKAHAKLKANLPVNQLNTLIGKRPELTQKGDVLDIQMDAQSFYIGKFIK